MKNKYLSLIFMVGFTLASFAVLIPATSYAVSPGCYRGSGSPNNPSYVAVTCPNEGSARAVSQFGACFLITGSSTTQERDCDDLDQAGDAVPESRTINNDGRIRCNDGSFIDDPATADSLPGGATLDNDTRDNIRDEACRNANKGGFETFNPNRLNGEAIDDELDVDCETEPGESLDSGNCAIVSYLVTAINLLSALAGIVIVFSIMFAGYQYMTARDNAGQIQQARTRIIWAISALLIFIFAYAGLNFLVPGGVL